MELTDKEVKELIENNPVAFASVDAEYKPNVIGVAAVKVVSENQVLVTDNYMKQNIENILQNNAVCLAVWNPGWEGYKLIGTAEYFVEGKWKEFVEKMSENIDLPAKGAILITITQLIKLG